MTGVFAFSAFLINFPILSPTSKVSDVHQNCTLHSDLDQQQAQSIITSKP